jgi:uncharacterized membrane protein YdbT with pleckstrin-like domain
MLQDGEEVMLDLRPHWAAIFPAAAALAVAIAVGVVVLVVTDIPAVRIVIAVGVLLALANFGLRYLTWTTTNFVVTTERLISRSGFLSRRATQIPLEKVNSVDFSQSAFERLLRSGDLLIESGADQGTQRFSNVRRPLAVQQEINRQMDHHEKQRWGGAPAAPASIPDQIEKLAQLRAQGVLTDAEFEAKKAQLLDRL